jgi:hypothetical protein
LRRVLAGTLPEAKSRQGSAKLVRPWFTLAEAAALVIGVFKKQAAYENLSRKIAGDLDERINTRLMRRVEDWKGLAFRIGVECELEQGPNGPQTCSPTIPLVPNTVTLDGASERKALSASYFSAFGEKIQVLDVCWAAGQHYSEWKRWLRGAEVLKDGSAPDLAFRSLLSSGKKPSEYRKQFRPKGWK